jgi:energy-converting hydrogenase Eha subunit A
MIARIGVQVKRTLTKFRECGSFIAGILVGLSIVVPVIALTGATRPNWQTFLLFETPMILVLGITLQAVITTRLHHHEKKTMTEPGQSEGTNSKAPTKNR